MSQLDYNFNEFLTLFTTQLQNQDPTNPMDTTAMTNQLAMFSEVEQQAGTNSRLDKLIAASPGGSLGSSVSYIGHTVEASGDQVALSSGTATIAYSLPSAGASATVEILNSSGSVVTTLTGSATSGTQQVTWDGTDSSGSTVADGAYTVSVSATDSSGKAITPTTYTSGTVTGVETSGSETLLDLGNGLQVSTSNVLAITS
jgi:flagellar basal-body rod modification protein FlgD